MVMMARRQVHASPAPGELETLRAFVNTLDIEEGTDDFAAAAGLGRWLSARGLAAAGTVTAPDLASAVALREALRGVLREHAGHHPGDPGQAPASGTPVAPGTAAGPAGELRAIATALPVRLGVDDRGRIAAIPAAAGVHGCPGPSPADRGRGGHHRDLGQAQGLRG